MRKQSEILEIMQIFADEDPAPKSELDYHNAYTLLVAIILSAQSSVIGVNIATK